MKTIRSVFWYLWNSAVETAWTSLICWPLTTSKYAILHFDMYLRDQNFFYSCLYFTFVKIQPETDNMFVFTFFKTNRICKMLTRKCSFVHVILEEKGKQITNVFDIFDYHLGTILQNRMEQKSFRKIKLKFPILLIIKAIKSL